MTHQEASAVVTLPLAAVQEALHDVESWSAFLVGVTQVTKTAHERYTFRITRGNRERDIPAVVRLNHKDHCFTWRSVTGPRFEGCLRLGAVDAGRTRVTLSLTSQPEGFFANMSEMVALSPPEVTPDVGRMEAYLTGRAVSGPGRV
jgi:hypothetical protein